MANIIINTSAARDDASQILNIINTITEDMATLEASIKKHIPENIQTKWSESLRDNWEKYYNSSIPAAMEEMKLSASNLQTAVAEAEKYSTEG
ncbi:MAG: hypothetical protein E7160_04470 [Firmicutes bacterium]|nr:hypothetical protein [Bacillota bacterium]